MENMNRINLYDYTAFLMRKLPYMEKDKKIFMEAAKQALEEYTEAHKYSIFKECIDLISG